MQSTKTRVLITIMTYPHPSRGYRELVCTAGVTEDNEWVRLYPIDYRYRPPKQRFRKYQWIEVELSDKGSGSDNRKESRRPNVDSIRLLGEPLSTKDGWRERRKIIGKLPVHTVKELRQMYDDQKVSLGIVHPSQVLDLKIEELHGKNREWKASQQRELQQLHLFEDQPKELAKIPFKFSYVFECKDSHKPHNAMIEDWELGVLYLKEVKRLGSEQKAAESVKHKFLNELCADDRDMHLFMGTTFPYNSWVALGVFYPPKIYQMELF